MSKALFLDRDGTLIFDQDYLADPAQVELLPGVTAALRQARTKGYRFFLFTNQSGVGRGYNTLEQVLACNRRMLELLGLGGDLFTDVCIATEAPDQPSHYRKPSPRFILESIARHALTPADCWMVGDRESDVQAGLNAGIHGVAVCTGKYDRAAWESRLPATALLFPDLAAFVATLS